MNHSNNTNIPEKTNFKAIVSRLDDIQKKIEIASRKSILLEEELKLIDEEIEQHVEEENALLRQLATAEDI
jgi:hypothetical protein